MHLPTIGVDTDWYSCLMVHMTRILPLWVKILGHGVFASSHMDRRRTRGNGGAFVYRYLGEPTPRLRGELKSQESSKPEVSNLLRGSSGVPF